MAVSSTGSRPGRGGIVFGAIAVGIGLLAGSLFLPWYSVALPPALEGGMQRGSGSYLETWGPWSVSYQFPAVLGNPCAGAAPTQNCSTPPSTWSTTFGQADLSDLSGLYLIAAGLALAAAVLGGVALFVRYIARGISPRVRTLTVGTLLAIAVLFAIAAPTFVALHQPATVCTDWTESGPVPLGSSPAAGSSAAGCGWPALAPGGGPTFSRGAGTPMGPGDSFVGSNASAGASWGPALGWFLPLLAGGTFAAALAIELLALRRGRSTGSVPVKPI